MRVAKLLSYKQSTVVGLHDRHSRLQHRTWFPKMSMLLAMNAVKISKKTKPKFIYTWKVHRVNITSGPDCYSVQKCKLCVYDGIFLPSHLHKYPHKYLHNLLSKSHPPSYQVSNWSLKSQIYDRQLIDSIERMKEPKNEHHNRPHLSHRNNTIVITVYGKTKRMQTFMSTVFGGGDP